MKSLPRYLIAFAICFAVFTSCGNNKSEEEDTTRHEEQSAYEALPDQLRSVLWQQCDYIDIIYFNHPVSMSQNDKPAIQGTLSFISGNPASPDPNCSALGRISFMVKGEIVAEADFFSTNQCNYFLFLEDGKAKYAETLTQAGINFFRQVTQRFMQNQ